MKPNNSNKSIHIPINEFNQVKYLITQFLSKIRSQSVGAVPRRRYRKCRLTSGSGKWPIVLTVRCYCLHVIWKIKNILWTKRASINWSLFPFPTFCYKIYKLICNHTKVYRRLMIKQLNILEQALMKNKRLYQVILPLIKQH